MKPLIAPSTELLTERDVAHIAKLSVAAIRRRRLLRQEPRYLKLNSSVRYRMEDIVRWLDSCMTSKQRDADQMRVDA